MELQTFYAQNKQHFNTRGRFFMTDRAREADVCSMIKHKSPKLRGLWKASRRKVRCVVQMRYHCCAMMVPGFGFVEATGGVAKRNFYASPN